MAGLPKKYAKLGFKKGWKAFKASKSISKTKRSTKSRSAPKVRTMAKRKAKTTRKRKGMNSDVMMVFGAMGYGAIREVISNKLAPITAKVPAGEISDEVVMLAVSYLTYKNKIPLLNKLKFSSSVGRAGVIIESARVGEFLANNLNLKMINTGSSSASNSALQVTVF